MVPYRNHSMAKLTNESPSRAEQAIEAFQDADRIDAKPRVSFGDDIVFKLDANRARDRAHALKEPEGILAVGAGEAVAWQPGADDRTAESFAATLERPTSISVAASEKRLRAAQAAGVLEAAVDTAYTARASNAIEKMLAHQLAAGHFHAMRLLERAASDRLQPVDAVRLVNASARLMDTYQAGCLALLKLKTRGQERVIVQHQQVNVSNGGQAVVTGTVRGGSRRRRGRRAKNEG